MGEILNGRDGRYTTDIGLEEYRGSILVKVVLCVLVWPIAMIAAVIVLLLLGEEYLKITLPLLFLAMLTIIPIVFIVHSLYKKYHKDNHLDIRSVVFEVRQGTVYMDGKKVLIKYAVDIVSEMYGFKIYINKHDGYLVYEGDTADFRMFLEHNGIPFVIED